MQEIIAHEDSSLKQEEGKADTVPDDPRFATGQLAFGVIFSCGIKQRRTQNRNEHLFASLFFKVYRARLRKSHRQKSGIPMG